MATIPVNCNSCGNGFDGDARKAGQSIPCPMCHARVEVPDVITAQPLVTAAVPAPAAVVHSPINPTPSESGLQRAKRLFSSMPRAVQLAAVGLLCLVLGYLIGWVRTVAARYSPAAYQEQVARADKAERELSALTAKHKEVEHEAIVFKVAAESRAKDVAQIRKLMNELRAEKGVPEWASKEKWAEAQAEIDRLKAAEDKAENAKTREKLDKAVAENAKLQSKFDEADHERRWLSAKLAAVEKRQESEQQQVVENRQAVSGGAASMPRQAVKTGVKKWSGTGLKSTEIFAIAAKDWTVSWQSESEFFSISVYDENGNLVSLAANVTGANRDRSELHNGPGRFYLEVNSFGGEWAIAVGPTVERK